MPIYEYACRDCGEDTEKLQKLSDDDLVDCPNCGKPSLTRKISAAAFRLAGSGWYETDFKKDGKRNLVGDSDSGSGSTSSKSKDSGTDSKTGSTDSGKSQAKSESKSESKSDTKSKAKTKAEKKSSSSSAAK